ncbi:NYN domain-containing protein [Promethearchaeum syntrophicum]|uniref:NYN domain-containing protein n=1 Tax=Promethearchaeum syntrophicum TaxID=2594042 RepID=A0A5B9D8Q3_9ARCH|nr:NYN domain-containing protein [Candidatus Prometheoarchaeum syntrophicum]QEE15006.1 NYN domain protein [Candidatus Prometheoarchaeum syntrophicum]
MWFLSTESVGIFWDYENVPLRHQDYKSFLTGLTNYINANNVEYFKVYYQAKSPISDSDFELLKNIPQIQFKKTLQDGPNAADNSLIQSCLDVLNNNEDINHVILISGDADFLTLIDQLHDWGVKITIICQQHNYSDDLITESQKAYTVRHISTNPYNWWIN